ncbi:MAG: hypothetical protein LBF75_07780, partial [Treponema sp.]|nr:hypothetical protein [Treponema sp.]
ILISTGSFSDWALANNSYISPSRSQTLIALTSSGIPAVLLSRVSSHRKLSFSSIGRTFLLSWLADSSLGSSRL